MKQKEHNGAAHNTMSLTEMFCKRHPATFMEPRFAGDRVFWECPACEQEFYYERKITERNDNE